MQIKYNYLKPPMFIETINRVFHNCWNKAVASQIFPFDFILFLFSDYNWEIVNILIYSTKYNETMPWAME